MKRTTTNLLNAALVLALGLGLAYVWPDDEASRQTAISEQGEAFRLARAAKKICKEKAAWTLIDGRVIQCFAEVKEVKQ